jgi:hypothetical protein
MVSEFLQENNDKQVKFRKELLVEYLAPYFSSSNHLIKARALSALNSFPEEEIQEYLTPPEQIIQLIKQESNKKIYAEYLIGRIRYECRTMTRPVFKGLGVQIGASKVKHSNSAEISNRILQLQSKIYTLWTSMESNIILRSSLSAAVLFAPPNESSLNEFAFLESICLKLLTDLVISDVPLQVIDCLEGWISFWSSSITKVLSCTKTKIQIEALKQNYGNLFAKIISGNLKGVSTPNAVVLNMICATGMIIAFFAMDIVPLDNIISESSTQLFTLLLDSTNSKEVKSASALLLSQMIASLPMSYTDKWVIRLYDILLAENNPTFQMGYSISALVFFAFRNMEKDFGENIFEQFIERFFGEDGKCSNEGATRGFAILINELPVMNPRIDSYSIKVKNYALNCLSKMNAQVDENVLNSCLHFVSYCSTADEANSIEQLLEKWLDFSIQQVNFLI